MSQTEIKAPPGKQEIIVTRTYNAPRELVFKTLTDPKLIPQWWGPRVSNNKSRKDGSEIRWTMAFYTA